MCFHCLSSPRTVPFPDFPQEKAFAVVGMLSGGFVFGMIVASLSDVVRKSNPGDTLKTDTLGGIRTWNSLFTLKFL